MVTKKSTRAEDYYRSHKDFQDDLLAAEKHADGELQHDFVGSIKDKYNKYGLGCFLSEEQYDWLVSIGAQNNPNRIVR